MIHLYHKVVYKLTQLLNLNITYTSIKEHCTYHSHAGSLAAIEDVLANYGIESMAVHISELSDLAEAPMPAIAEIKGDDYIHSYSYVIITKYGTQGIEFDDPINKQKKLVSPEEFEQMWTGSVLLVSAEDAQDEEYYKGKHQAELIQWIARPWLIAMTITGLGVIFSTTSFVESLWLCCQIVGVAIGIMLYIKNFATQNSVIDKFCSVHKKVNCDSVLESASAQITHWLSLSDLVLYYFVVGLVSNTLGVITNQNIIGINNIVALFSLPAIFYSLYQQAFVLKTWCTLCLGVVVILLVEVIMAFLFLSPYVSEITLANIAYYAYTALFIIPVIVILKSLLRNSLSLYEAKRAYQVKYNIDTFQLYLKTGTQYTFPIPQGHVIIGNEDAPVNITIVKSPYCGACTEAYKVLSRLVKVYPEEVKITLIWDCYMLGEKQRATIVKKYFMALNIEQKQNVPHALDLWSETKDFTKLQKMYGLHAEPDSTVIDNIIQDNHKWGRLNQINSTPTVYINDNKIPESYQVSDLKYLIRNYILNNFKEF